MSNPAKGSPGPAGQYCSGTTICVNRDSLRKRRVLRSTGAGFPRCATFISSLRPSAQEKSESDAPAFPVWLGCLTRGAAKNTHPSRVAPSPPSLGAGGQRPDAFETVLGSPNG